jgi:PleD family two-component response regulator
MEIHGGTLTVFYRRSPDTKTSMKVFIVTLLKGNRHFSADLQVFIPTDSEQTNSITVETKGQQNQIQNDERNTLLLVGENTEFRGMLKEVFAAKYCVLDYTNGADAFKTAIRILPDIVVSDILIQEVDGIELCRKHKKKFYLPHSNYPAAGFRFGRLPGQGGTAWC